MAVHVPAWKRLGLKLKYANEQPDGALNAPSTKAHDPDSQASERPVKRRKVAKDGSSALPVQSGRHSSSIDSDQIRAAGIDSLTNGSAIQSQSPMDDSDRPVQRKKSVTFTDETKQEDGDSRITIDFPASSPGSTPKRSRKVTDSNSRASSSPSQVTAEGSKRIDLSHDKLDTPGDGDKSMVSKGDKKSTSGKHSTRDKSGSALEYLAQHHSDRAAWKFNKILDVWILNHARDLQAIPTTHTLALCGYVRGLPAKAGSRTRLMKDCRDVLTTSQVTGDKIEEDQKALIKLLESRPESLQTSGGAETFENPHSRAAILLWALGEKIGSTATDTLTKSSAQHNTVTPARKKKSRTSAPIDISSSSESDSDTDSDELSESGSSCKAISNGKERKVNAASTSKDDTSSSGTSSESEASSDSSSSDGEDD